MINVIDPLSDLEAQTLEVSENSSRNLTSQEAFDKYGPDDDRFYTSQGLDPVIEKEKINKLNQRPSIYKKVTARRNLDIPEKFDAGYYIEINRIINSFEREKYNLDTKEFSKPLIDTNYFTKEEFDLYEKAKKLKEKMTKEEYNLLSLSDDFIEQYNKYYEILSTKDLKTIATDTSYLNDLNENEITAFLENKKVIFKKWAKDNNIDVEDENDYLKFLVNQEKLNSEVIHENESILIQENMQSSVDDIVQKTKNEMSSTAEDIEKNTEKLTNKKITEEAEDSITKGLNKSKVLKGVGIAAVVGGIIYAGKKHHDKKEKEKYNQQQAYKQQQEALFNSDNNYDNTYAQQIASDISSYRYGKKMTGFVNN